MSLIAKGLGRLAMVSAAGLLFYVGLLIVNGAVSAVTASGSPDPDAANRTAAEQLFEQGKGRRRIVEVHLAGGERLLERVR